MAVEENTKPLTALGGRAVVDNQNSMSARQRGPLLLQDLWLIEKLAHFRWVATRRLVAAARATSVVLRARRGDRSGRMATSTAGFMVATADSTCPRYGVHRLAVTPIATDYAIARGLLARVQVTGYHAAGDGRVMRPWSVAKPRQEAPR